MSMERPGNFAMLRCRKCRKGYVDSTCLYPIVTGTSSTAATCSVWHINVETLPDWILTSVYQAHWTVGKLNCQSCGARLGGFNFINHTKCPCGQEITVHLSKSRVDHDHKRSLNVVRPRKGRLGGGHDCLPAESGCSQTEQDRSEPMVDLLTGSQFCYASVSHLNPESQSITTLRDPLQQLTDSQVTQSSHHSNPLALSKSKCFFSNERSRSELETSNSPLGLSQSRPMDKIEGGERCWKKQSPHSIMEPYTSQLPDTVIDGSPNVACLSHVSRGGRSMLESEEDHTCLQLHGSWQTPEDPVQGVEASGSPPLSLTGTTVNHHRREPQEDGDQGQVHEVWGSPAGLQVPLLAPTPSSALHRLSKREKNCLKSQRRKLRRRDRWIHRQLEKEQSVPGLTDSEEEGREGYTCAVCLDVYYSPYSCHPCGHVFCEPCLRTLAKNRPASTPCPLCRTLITHTLFQKELNQSAKTFFPKVYHSRKQNYQKASCAKWPLPNCKRRFQIFWGYQRQAVADRRWQFAPAGFTFDALDLADMRGWLFDIDLVIIYIHSVNWILALLILCFLAYFFFS